MSEEPGAKEGIDREIGDLETLRARLAGMVDTRENRFQLLVTVLLAFATVTTAWSSYQAARWSGLQAISFSEANAARVESSRLSNIAAAQVQIDALAFVTWIDAVEHDEQELAEFYFNRFSAGFRSAVEAWQGTEPRTNPDAPLTPFDMPEYTLEARTLAGESLTTAEAATEEAKENNQRSDNYLLAVVLFATSLFFAGVSTRLDTYRFKATILTLGYVLFTGTLVWVATFPVTVSV